MNPKFPVFIPTKGRYEQRYTVKTFEALGVPYTVFVEKQEYDKYRRVIPEDRIHVLPHRDKGVTVTRNYMWDYAESIGVDWYWSFDDNIKGLFRFNNNLKVPVADGTIMRVIEDFTLRYENIGISGMHYFMFVPRKLHDKPPYTLNSRVYSNMLIRTDLRDKENNKIRFTTFFNEDTDLCLRVLKNDWCTVLFNAFLIGKETTMTSGGGNTEYYKQTDRRRQFAEELRDAHPDVVTVVERWGRIHHYVDYRHFVQQLKRRSDIEIPRGVNNFGMVLEERVDDSWRRLDLGEEG